MATETAKHRQATDIQWDADGLTIEECELPSSVDIPDNVADEDVGDWLSNEYGFCHTGFVLTR